MASDKYIYIGYSKQDAVVVDMLSSALQKEGLKVWRDVEQISAGTNWSDALKKGVSEASAFIYIGSKHSMRSSNITFEFGQFFGSGGRDKPIIPIMIDDTHISDMHPTINVYHALHLSRGIDNVIDTIVERLNWDVTPAEPVEPKANQSKGYVFISYAEEDTDFVLELKKFMKEYGYGYWDYDESDRDYHSQLFLELEGVITEAAATLTILSEDWKKSPWTVKEYFFSEAIGIPVFLLRAKEIGPTLAIAGIPYIDFVPDVSAGFTKLKKELIRKKL